MNVQDLTEIRAEGRQLYPFINAVRHSEIICLAQHCSGETFCCKIRSSDQKELEALAKNYHLTIHASPCPSLSHRLKRFRRRIGIPIGVMLCGALLFFCSNLVAVIELQGVDTASEQLILQILEEEGVKEGIWIPGIDFTHCERRIRMAVPGIAWVGMRRTGNRLVVEISESTPKPEMLYSRQTCNIVAQYDAQITDVRVYSGHLTRLIGDGVAQGELLVSGVFEDEKGHITYHHAMASITGIYTQEIELTEYFTVTQRVLTGRQQQKRYLQLFGLRIPLQFGSCSFADALVCESRTPYSLLSRNLPVSLVRESYMERETQTITRSEEETQLALNAAIVRFEKNFLSDVTILGRQIETTVTEDGITSHLLYTVEGEIGIQSDLFVP